MFLNKGINVLSLFDGMSCGRIALGRSGIAVDTYYAAEIDKYATQVSHANYPDIIRFGDVTKWREWDVDWASVDLLLGGFPCQAWSTAGRLTLSPISFARVFYESDEERVGYRGRR